ncbi:hypothetical protein [Streptosporangium jomthongense]|uniref:Phosphodiesterase n=1 Tax=Streptosporangium jomthongense TaxID=1193683 RepID=A0ABV8F434_9ACTN
MKDRVVRAVGAGLAAVSEKAARLRHGRPLHPDGLVLHAALRLRGVSPQMGAAFLDEPMTLTGVARLSRAAGLPPPLPDILGLAVRWSAAGLPGDTGEGVCDLLLATTGHTVLGRRALRPTRRWAPGMYGSLLSFALDGRNRKVLLGAVARSSWASWADLDELALAVEREPLVLDLVVAHPLTPWRRFGLLELTGPPLPDSAAPMRFDPARHPIPGLPPAGVMQRVRGPVYAAAQRVPQAGVRDRDRVTPG